MIYKNGERMRDFWAFLFLLQSSFLHFGGVFNKTIIPLALVGYEMVIANSALRASLAIYQGPYAKHDGDGNENVTKQKV